MTVYITELAEVEINTAEFLRCLRDQENVKKARSMLKNSKYFFAYFSQGKWIFAPSRFVGFKNNTISQHEIGVSEKSRNGVPIDKILTDISLKADPSSILYSSLETSFKEFCNAQKTTPSAKLSRRHYWVSTHDIGHIPVNSNTSWEDQAGKLAKTILQTVKASGSKRIQTTKLKSTDMDLKQLSEFITQKMIDQKFTCKLTDIKMKNTGDPSFYPSPDRIDSNQGYFRDNIQIVCQFANKWKSDQPNEDFLKLIEAIKNA